MKRHILRGISLGAFGFIGLSGCASDANDGSVGSARIASLSVGLVSEASRCEQYLHPIVNCVAPSDNDTLVAHFGYVNPQGAMLTIPVGPHNMFIPSPFDQGQPTSFASGESDNVVSVAFDAKRGPLRWKLDEAHAVASGNSPPCVPTFAGATSAEVVSDTAIKLTWISATDYTTPSSGIVYDICWSTVSGICAADFAITQSTSGGETSSTIAGLNDNTDYFFIVRARNAVDNHDNNTVEVSARTYKSAAAVALASGNAHTCAMATDGTVRCWGANAYGQLGNGTVSDYSTPQRIHDFSVTALSPGSNNNNHTCAIAAEGTVQCWGQNEFGELGNQTTIDSSAPVPVVGLTGVKSVAAGGPHTCALLTDGTVQCWGYNNNGELGNGTTVNSLTPVAVTGLVNVTAISAGIQHTCALLMDGTIRCWGSNQFTGALGNGTTNDSSTPVPVLGISNATAITTGGHHTCALLADGGVMCWGWNVLGQLGHGSTISPLTTPVSVLGLSDASAIAAGFAHSCARRTDGTVVCWGANEKGELGNGTFIDSSTPVPVVQVSGATFISTGGFHSCAIQIGGTILCWGADYSGQLGNGTFINSDPFGSPIPVEVSW